MYECVVLQQQEGNPMHWWFEEWKHFQHFHHPKYFFLNCHQHA